MMVITSSRNRSLSYFSAGVMQKQNSAFEFTETFHRKPPVPFGFGANTLSRDGADRWHVFWPLGRRPALFVKERPDLLEHWTFFL
jgi:hypothetical protein